MADLPVAMQRAAASARAEQAAPPPGQFAPTDEQIACLDLFTAGQSFTIEAGAGTGKTSTLELLARSAPNRRGQYVTFNNAIVKDSRLRMPGTVNSSTAHSLAHRDVGRNYAHRFDTARMKGSQIAKFLGLGQLTVELLGKPRRLSPPWLASQTIKLVREWCKTPDRELTADHLPHLRGVNDPGSTVNDRIVGDYLLPYARRAWADICDAEGVLPFDHAYYLKMWQLGEPVIVCDYLTFDEAQDASPVMLDVVARQASHAQLIFVGDSQQAIYEFTGAVNALERVRAEGIATGQAWLTQSFRFGPPIAAVANYVLGLLGAELRITGTPAKTSVVGPVAMPDAVLCRTNAVAVATMIRLQLAGAEVALVGDEDAIAYFCRAAIALKAGQPTAHPELACFDTWGEVQEYAEHDPIGSDLRLMVDVIDEFGAEQIMAAMHRSVHERHAAVTVSTAHKAKGREWSSVKLADDFPMIDPGTDFPLEELRLLYVAATRARHHLDVSQVPLFQGRR